MIFYFPCLNIENIADRALCIERLIIYVNKLKEWVGEKQEFKFLVDSSVVKGGEYVENIWSSIILGVI